jgi:hypothetical protein
MITRTNTVPADLQEKVLLGGDLSRLTPAERLSYYNAVCTSVGLNPLTRPFEYLVLNQKMVLYARKDCTDQLRDLHTVSITIQARELVDGVYVVTARAANAMGRTDESIGAVPLPTNPADKANAMMKAETKAKRRVTLSICGLGILDETELDTVPQARVVEGEVPKPSTKPSDILKRAEQGAVLEPSVKDFERDMQKAQVMGVDAPKVPSSSSLGRQDGSLPQSHDAPEPQTEDPAMPYRRKIKVADTVEACNAAYQATPEPLKQDVHGDYFDTLKSLSKKKK